MVLRSLERWNGRLPREDLETAGQRPVAKAGVDKSNSLKRRLGLLGEVPTLLEAHTELLLELLP